MDQMSATRPFDVWLWISLLLLMSLGALAGGGALLLAPEVSLLQMPVSILAGTPFRDYLLPGALLCTFVGVYPLVTAYGLYKRPAWAWGESLNPFKGTHWSWAGAVVAGIIVMVWITVQILLIGYLHPIQPFYFVLGAGGCRHGCAAGCAPTLQHSAAVSHPETPRLRILLSGCGSLSSWRPGAEYRQRPAVRS